MQLILIIKLITMMFIADAHYNAQQILLDTKVSVLSPENASNIVKLAIMHWIQIDPALLHAPPIILSIKH
jgi:hypothetical protein